MKIQIGSVLVGDAHAFICSINEILDNRFKTNERTRPTLVAKMRCDDKLNDDDGGSGSGEEEEAREQDVI